MRTGCLRATSLLHNASVLALLGPLLACGAEEATTGAAFPSAPPAAEPAGNGASNAGSGAMVDAGIATSTTPAGSVSTVMPTEEPGALCQEFTIANGRVTPDMLIVLDRSSSMQNAAEGIDRWTPSVSGLKAITAELHQLIRFGLMAFPGRGSDPTMGGGMQCAPGSLEVPIAINAGPAIATSLDGLSLIQSTPTATTLSEAHKVVGTGVAQVDATVAAKYVILVTDGAPNCSNGQAGGGRGGAGQDPAAVAASVAAIAAMQKDGIKTYVLGYGTQSDAQLKAALDEMARAGGTGDTAHRAIENEANLVQEFRRITGSAISCEFKLNMAPSDPNYVLVQLDGMKLNLKDPDGFVLSDDKLKLTVQGGACKKLQNAGENHMVTVKVECERQTPLN